LALLAICSAPCVLKERKLPAGKYFIISHSGSNLIKGALAQPAASVELSYASDVN
jgi:hypothetical protein